MLRSSSLFLLCALLIFCTYSFNIYSERYNKVQVVSDNHSVMGINWPFTICGQGSWTIQKVIMGAAPVRNKNVDIDVIGTAGAQIHFKNVNLNVKLNGVSLHSEDMQFTDSYESGDTIEFKAKSFIPEYAPPGSYTIAFTFTDSTGKAQGCFLIAFKI